MNITEEIIEKAKELKTVEELIAFAKENGEELTHEKAEELFAKLHQTGELSDDELDNVSGGCGGGGGRKGGRPGRPYTYPEGDRDNRPYNQDPFNRR